MFMKNKYLKFYYAIIDNASKDCRSKGNGIYYESHHILPKSLGGSNSKSNLVLLTAREHYLCHLLLIKITDEEHRSKMIYALWRLSNGNTPVKSRQYEIARKNHIQLMKETPKTEEHKRKISEANKGKTLSEEHKAKLRNPKSEEHKEKLRKPKKNKENIGKYERTEETRRKLSESHKGIQAGENNPMFGRSHSAEVKQSHSDRMKGNQNGKGKVKSEDARAKMSARAKNRKATVCPHCHGSYVGSNYTRWHGDNCKSKVVT